MEVTRGEGHPLGAPSWRLPGAAWRASRPCRSRCFWQWPAASLSGSPATLRVLRPYHALRRGVRPARHRRRPARHARRSGGDVFPPVLGDVHAAQAGGSAVIHLQFRHLLQLDPPLGPIVRDRLGWLVIGCSPVGSPRATARFGPAAKTLPASSVAIVGVRLKAWYARRDVSLGHVLHHARDPVDPAAPRPSAAEAAVEANVDRCEEGQAALSMALDAIKIEITAALAKFRPTRAAGPL